MATITTSNNSNKQDPDFSGSAVPDNARMGRGSLTMAWWALCSAMIWLLISATLAVNYGSKNALFGLALAVLTYGIINGVISRYAVRTGLSVALFSRIVYGRVGEILATAIFLTIAIYYSVFEGSVIAVAIASYFPEMELWHAYLLVVAYSVPLVFGGISAWLDKLNGVLLPFYVVGLLGSVVFAVYQYGYSDAWLAMGPNGGLLDSQWWNCYSYFMGLWVMMLYTWDYARFGKHEDQSYHSKINFGIPFYTFTFLLNGIIGIFLVATIPSEEALSETAIVFALLKLMGVFGLIFIWVSQTRINTANFQLATVNTQAFIGAISSWRPPKVAMAIVVGIIVFCMMLTDVFSFLLTALSYQGVFVVAWVVVALTHMALDKRNEEELSRLEYRSAYLPMVRLGGISAWLLATTAGLLLLVGPDKWALFSVPVTVVVAASVYWFSFTRSELMSERQEESSEKQHTERDFDASYEGMSK